MFSDGISMDGELHFGSFSVSIATIAGTAAAIALTLLAVGLLGRLTERARKRVGEKRAGTLYVGGQVLRYAIIVAGSAIAASTLGVDLSTLSLFAGALGVGIGLGLQDVIKNFVCGLILMFDGSVEIGDYIELDDGTSGEVVAIGPRATTLLTADNVDILLPNADLLGGKLTNWTRNRASRRIHVPFCVAYGSDKEVVRQAALDAAHSTPFTMPDAEGRRTQVWLVGFGDSALDFELVVWPNLAAVKRPGSMMAAYRWALDDALRKYGIEIPYPQLDLNVRSWFQTSGAAARDAWHGRAVMREDAEGTALSKAGENDAARDIADVS